MTPRTRTPLAGTAVTVAVAAAAVLAPAAAAGASEAGGVLGAPDTTRPRDAVTVAPAPGAVDGTLVVRAGCASGAADAAVYSPAFMRPAELRPAPGGGMVAVAAVRHGLASGRAYVVTANCSPTESLTTTFVPTTAGAADHTSDVGPANAPGPARDAATDTAGAEHAATGAVAAENGGTENGGTENGATEDHAAVDYGNEGDPNQVDGVALAFGGGLAGAALAGYVLTARRAAARRRAARRRAARSRVSCSRPSPPRTGSRPR